MAQKSVRLVSSDSRKGFSHRALVSYPSRLVSHPSAAVEMPQLDQSTSPNFPGYAPMDSRSQSQASTDDRPHSTMAILDWGEDDTSTHSIDGKTGNHYPRHAAPPRMIIEGASPGRRNQERDYSRKLAQYQAIGVGKYWIADPSQRMVTVFRMESSGYINVGAFRGRDVVPCSIYPGLTLTAEQILNAG
jgi:hypothetical protein